MDIKLIMFRHNGLKRVFPLPFGTTTIGRKTECDIRIPLAEVSRSHATVHVDEDGAYIKDLGAANGTYLNNQRITEEDLEPGDQIMIGPVVFTVQIDGDPPDEKIKEVRTKATAGARPGARVGTSKNVFMSDEETDPIAALEALASSTDQTAINPEDED